MSKKIALAFFLSFSVCLGFGQSIDSLRLTDTEIPADYIKSEKLLCATVHANSFYTQANLFESLVGKIVKKDFQSFEKKGDTGQSFTLNSKKTLKPKRF